MAASATPCLFVVDRASASVFLSRLLPLNSICRQASASFSVRFPKGLCAFNISNSSGIRGVSVRALIMSHSTFEEKLGVKVERNPSEDRISSLGIKSWPKWGCPPSKFPWTYDATETCYLLKGKVKVYPEAGSSDHVEIGAGDLVVFPKGMSCTWEVTTAVDKHYTFS